MAITLNTAPVVATWYTPEAEKEAEKPARFRLQPLTERQRLQVLFAEGVTGDAQIHLTPAQIEEALAFGLVDWEGIDDAKGKPVRFNKRALDLLPMALRVELAGEIINRTSLSEEAQGN